MPRNISRFSVILISTLASIACQPAFDPDGEQSRCLDCTESTTFDTSGTEGGGTESSGFGSGEAGAALHITECANDLIGFTGSIIEAVNAIPVPLASRTMADVLTCPVDTGVGEQSHVNIFSYVGPLDKGCNRGFVDDCTDPDRFNYWISVVDDRRTGADPYSFRVIWGDEDRVPGTEFVLDYYYYGSCSPDPYGYDNPEAGIPRLLTPVHDNDGDGQISLCPAQNHVYLFKFYTLDGNGMKVYIEKDDIAHISTPFLVPAWIPLPGLSVADHDAENSSAYVGVKIMLKDMQGTAIDAFIETNDSTEWVQWKTAEPCGAPAVCGDGIVEGDEECDGSTQQGGMTCLPNCELAEFCDPLAQDCEGSDLCVYDPMDPNAFICVSDDSGEEGQLYEVCETINACDKGLLCANPALALECDPQAGGCCLPYCDLSVDPPMSTCTGMSQECLPWYEMGMAPSGLENVGVCGILQ